jgi:multidrug efflux pump subunit AcrB
MGKDAVLINVYQQPGGNSVQIARNVKARLDEIHSKLPPGVFITSWYDQSQLVTSSAASVRDAIMIGAVLAALVLLVFLKSWRVTLIALLVVPASL